MITDALKYLVGLGAANRHEVYGEEYCDKMLLPVKPSTCASLNVSTLTAVVDYILEVPDRPIPARPIIVIEGPTLVQVISPLMAHEVRNNYVTSEPSLPAFRVDNWTPLDQFVPMIQSGFTDNYGQPSLIKTLAHISDETSIKTVDDGTSQQVEVREGIKKKYANLPNPVVLQPYATFPEIEQPEIPYVLRLNRQNGVQARLIEADGGAWEAACILRIKEYLANLVDDKAVILA